MTTAAISELCVSLGERWTELEEVQRLLHARLEHAPSRLTQNTYRLAKAVFRETARRKTWNEMTKAIFVMLDVLPHLLVAVSEDQRRKQIAEIS